MLHPSTKNSDPFGMHNLRFTLMCFSLLASIFQMFIVPSEAQVAQRIALVSNGKIKEGEVASNLRIRNKILLGSARNLVYRRAANGQIGISLQRGEGSFRLVAQNVIPELELAATSPGTFTMWDNNSTNPPVAATLQSGQMQVLATQWIAPSRWVKFRWSGTREPSAITLTHVTIGRLSEVVLPNPTPTIAPILPTVVPPIMRPTVIPTVHATPIPTLSFTVLPEPTPTLRPTATLEYTATPLTTPTPLSTQLACPGFIIEGFARETTGGCDGGVYEVTTLEDPPTAIPGTFRYGVQNLSGKRIIRFRVSGTIALRKDILILNGDLTIDGSSAPGAGVQFSGGTLIVSASNVILRHLRVLVGPYSQNPGKADNIRIVGDRGVWVENVVIDHCSMFWATDENISITDKSRKITVQWSIVAEGLYLSTHGKNDPHSMGALLHHDATQITFHHNLFAHNNYRNPQLASRGELEWINNVVYNTGSAAGILQTPEIGDENWLDAIGNYNKMGPNSDWAGSRYRFSWREGVVFGASHLYVSGNIDWNRTTHTQDESLVVAPYLRKWLSSIRLVQGSDVRITSASQAYQDVLNHAGATAPCRSPVDNRILEETRQGTGGFINFPSERGGWPDLTQGCQ